MLFCVDVLSFKYNNNDIVQCKSVIDSVHTKCSVLGLCDGFI